MACTATVRPWSVARDSRPRSSSWVWLGWPWGKPSGDGPAYGSQHHAVLVLREPSLMIFSGPIRARSSQPGSGSPVRSPASITPSSPSA